MIDGCTLAVASFLPVSQVHLYHRDVLPPWTESPSLEELYKTLHTAPGLSLDDTKAAGPDNL